MIRCDAGHTHEALEAATACVSLRNSPKTTETRATPFDHALAPNPPREQRIQKHHGGRPRKHADAAARQRAYRERLKKGEAA